MPRRKARKRSWAGQGGTANKVRKSSRLLQNISPADIPEPSAPSSQGPDSYQFAALSHERGFQEPIHASQDVAAQQTRPTSHAYGDVSSQNPTLAGFVLNMPRTKARKRSWAGEGGTTNKVRKSSRLLQNISPTDIPEPSTPSSQETESFQFAALSHESGFQEPIHASQDVAAQQTDPTSHAYEDVSSHNPTLASHETINLQARRHIVPDGIRPLKVNGDTFFPHDAVRDVTVAFKKSFTGSWHSWSKVPKDVRDQWFNDFVKKYSFPNEEKYLIRKTFDRVGRDRLGDTLTKAKREFAKTNKKPEWISQSHWDGLMQHWNSDDFKRISAINSKNRMSCNNGEGPSLHTGGSVPFAEYRRRHKEQTGQDLRNDDLFLKTHKTKDKEWVCEKSQRVWSIFTKKIKKKVEGASTSRNENGSEVEGDVDRNTLTSGDEGGIDRNTVTNGDEEPEEANEDNVVNLLKTIPDEQILNTWIDAVGGAKKGKLYGLGLETGTVRYSLHAGSASSIAPAPPSVTPQQIVETPEFEQVLDRVLEKRMSAMQASIQASMQASIQEVMRTEIEKAVREVMSRMLGLHPPP